MLDGMRTVLLPAQEQDFEFALAAKKDALGPHIVAKWGWDEDLQRRTHIERWAQKPWQLILLDEQPIGTISIDWRPSHLQFGEFYILSSYRGRGIGSAILKDVLSVADTRAMETRLEYIKWNPVASLYLRHGFRVTSESENHYFATRSPHAV
jgi:GNAT superfamily N-acetyltransferase